MMMMMMMQGKMIGSSWTQQTLKNWMDDNGWSSVRTVIQMYFCSKKTWTRPTLVLPKRRKFCESSILRIWMELVHLGTSRAVHQFPFFGIDHWSSLHCKNWLMQRMWSSVQVSLQGHQVYLRRMVRYSGRSEAERFEKEMVILAVQSAIFLRLNGFFVVFPCFLWFLQASLKWLYSRNTLNLLYSHLCIWDKQVRSQRETEWAYLQ